METPHDVFRQQLATTNDPIAAIKAIRARFGLSLIEAKEVWVQVTRGISLMEHQQQISDHLEAAFQKDGQQNFEK